jgi:hypothetical protein
VVLLGTYGRTLEELDRIILGTTKKSPLNTFPKAKRRKKEKKEAMLSAC